MFPHLGGGVREIIKGRTTVTDLPNRTEVAKNVYIAPRNCRIYIFCMEDGEYFFSINKKHTHYNYSDFRVQSNARSTSSSNTFFFAQMDYSFTSSYQPEKRNLIYNGRQGDKNGYGYNCFSFDMYEGDVLYVSFNGTGGYLCYTITTI